MNVVLIVTLHNDDIKLKVIIMSVKGVTKNFFLKIHEKKVNAYFPCLIWTLKHNLYTMT